jgi:hypothetical protein
MDIGEGLIISRTAKLDKTNPLGVHIGKYKAGSTIATAMCPQICSWLET